jgi:predicted ester cyclase
MRINQWLCAVALVASAGACKKDSKDAANETKTQGKTTSKEPEETKTPDTKTPDTKTPETKTEEMTAEKMAARYGECWGFFNDRKWDDFKGCFAEDAKSSQVDSGQPEIKGAQAIADDAKNFATAFPDAKGEVQLTLIGSNHVVGIVLMTGTNDGPMKGPTGEMAATKKKIGLLIGHVIDFDTKTGLATEEISFIDSGNFLGQLGVLQVPHREPMTASLPEKGTIAISKEDDLEKKNLEVHHAAVEAFNKHDIAALGATRTEDVQMFDASSPADVDAKTMAAGLQQLWKAFSDFQIQVGGEYGAGEYVVYYGQMSGTNDGDMGPKVKATGKKVAFTFLNIQHYKDGKIDKGWLFSNGLAVPTQLGLLK